MTTLGGGERYQLIAADSLRAHADIVVAAPEIPAPDRLTKFGIPSDFTFLASDIRDLPQLSAGFDKLVYLTNQLPQPTRARQSFLIVQFPFDAAVSWRDTRVRLRQARLLGDYRCVVYSRFVKRWVRRRWGRRSTLLAPPVESGQYQEDLKEDIVLAVGRFFNLDGHTKGQHTLVEAFRALPSATRRSWRLILVGGVLDDVASHEYVEMIREAATGTSGIEVHTNISADELRRWFTKAKLFWHAAGYPRDEARPERSEHFGMSTVEAMSFGAVPLVFAAGGQLEIVRPEFGHLWEEPTSLVDRSTALMVDEQHRRELSARAVKASTAYAEGVFRSRCRHLFL